MYWGAAYEPRCDSCDCDGNFIGLDCNIGDCWSWFWGYGCGRCSPCGCDGGSCGGSSCGCGGGHHDGGCASCGSGGYAPADVYLNGGRERTISPKSAPKMQEMELPPQPAPDMSARTRRGPSYGKVASSQVHVTRPGRAGSNVRTVSHTAPAATKATAATRSAVQASFSKPQPAAPQGHSGGRVVRFQTTAPGASTPLNYEIELRDGETLVDSPVLSAGK
jgi:hypothetical protein